MNGERGVLDPGGGPPAEAIEAVVQQTSLVEAADRCASCGQPLASDQRYCLSCGERRGNSRFRFAAAASTPGTTTTVVSARPRAPRSLPGGTTIIAGVGTLLLALGVGVLIGRYNNGVGARQVANTPVQVVTLRGGSSSGGAPSGSAAPQGGRSGRGHRGARAARGSGPAPVVAHKAAAAAGRVLGSKNLPPPTVKVGSHGSGPGFQHHKFTGVFFGQ